MRLATGVGTYLIEVYFCSSGSIKYLNIIMITISWITNLKNIVRMSAYYFYKGTLYYMFLYFL